MVLLFWPRPIVAQRHGEHKVPKPCNEISLRAMGSFVCPFRCPSRGTSHGDSLPRGTPSQAWTPSLEGLPLRGLPPSGVSLFGDSLPMGTPSLEVLPRPDSMLLQTLQTRATDRIVKA